MPKAILTLDEINLLLKSEEAKNINLYGNLYSVLSQLKPSKAVSIDNLIELDDKGKNALTYNKNNLFDTIIKEWYTVNKSEEDPKKTIRCGLCNTPNKYVFFIRNRINSNTLNVGSSCIRKFPGLEGYEEIQKQKRELIKNQNKINRRNSFLTKFPNAVEFNREALNYFGNLPILLSYDLYVSLEEVTTKLQQIYSSYINDGTNTRKEDVFNTFQNTIDLYNDIKIESDKFIAANIDKKFCCRRKQIDWLINNNKKDLLYEIAHDNGKYTKTTIGQMTDPEFIKENYGFLISKNKSNIMTVTKYNSNLFYLEYNKKGYNPPLKFTIKAQDFMQNIGSRCFFKNLYVYDEDELLNIAQIDISINNMISIINYTLDMMEPTGHVFLIDDTTNKIYLYRKRDKAIRQFSMEVFLSRYCNYLLRDDAVIKSFLQNLITTKISNWQTIKVQEQHGIFEKINILYKKQYS